ncbi:GTPase HflX [Peptostreptococcus canis]|uniref:GTPase HflX n=1 Tax=Peptostreptococcus canis TaxID=1159213 RepID=A0ABR6TJ10_9FIRM|nr:GTPase HflX [Peptostreptococcus canis]MBC2575390.1 GTPase HflX [Peptostreptococcus canis]MBP1997426.1 GTP-binding protein HflX [Peptostreptococcus canis]
MERLTISNKDVSNFDEVAIAIAVAEGKIIHATTVDESMTELCELVQAAGAEVKAKLILHQNIDENYYLDRDSLDYVIRQGKELNVNILVFIDELSGKQIKNIEKLSGMKVVDRTMLLFEILSNRANRREGKIEIEKAQLTYRLTRIEGFQGIYKYGTGICVNNPYGNRLLTDLDEIKSKIESLKVDLSVIVKNRFVQRSKKIGDSLPLVAFTGYTNSGKSALMNKLIELDPEHTKENEVIVKDKMLSTMDVSLRKSILPNGKEFLVVDTIGFVSDVPKLMLTAFRSTFEEISYADLIINVFDASSSGLDIQKNIMDYTIERIGVTNKKKISVYNKADKLDTIPESTDDKIYVSAKTGYNIDKLLEAIQKNLSQKMVEEILLIPYEKYHVFNSIKDNRIIEINDFKLIENGIELRLVMNSDEYEKYKEFIK